MGGTRCIRHLLCQPFSLRFPKHQSSPPFALFSIHLVLPWDEQYWTPQRKPTKGGLCYKRCLSHRRAVGIVVVKVFLSLVNCHIFDNSFYHFQLLKLSRWECSLMTDKLFDMSHWYSFSKINHHYVKENKNEFWSRSFYIEEDCLKWKLCPTQGQSIFKRSL